jgi:hypothetical protein
MATLDNKFPAIPNTLCRVLPNKPNFLRMRHMRSNVQRTVRNYIFCPLNAPSCFSPASTFGITLPFRNNLAITATNSTCENFTPWADSWSGCLRIIHARGRLNDFFLFIEPSTRSPDQRVSAPIRGERM